MDDNVAAEFAAIKRKLQSKSEALSILNRELATCKRERDHFKQLFESKRANDGTKDSFNFEDLTLNCTEKLPYLTEIEELKKKLKAAHNEIKELRGECGRGSRVTWHQREEMIEEIEDMREKIRGMSADLQSVLDEKEEIAVERDAYRFKVHRLNHELQILLKSKTAIDIDSLVLENVYLKDRFEQVCAEKEMLQQASAKYKTMLDKNRVKGNVRLGSSTPCSGMIVTHRQVHELLESDNSVWKSPYNADATLADLRSLSLALLEALQDKSLALTHQRKANKILAQRVTNLESRLSDEIPAYPSQALLQGFSNSVLNKDNDKSVVEEYREYLKQSTENSLGKEPANFTSSANVQSNVNVNNEEDEALPPDLQELVMKAMEEIKVDSLANCR